MLGSLIFFVLATSVIAKECGPGIGSCPAGTCCSRFSFCGSSVEHCTNCQPLYGNCLSTAAPTSTRAVVFKQCRASDMFALTFDDGPEALTANILSILRRHQVRATFFQICSNLEIPWKAQIARQIYADGHQIGNHEYIHRNLNSLSNAELRDGISRCNELFSRVVGRIPKYFRAPWGSWPETNSNFLSRMGFGLIHWNLDPKDWTGNGPQAIVNEVSSQLSMLRGQGIISVLHDTKADSVAALDGIISTVKARGYRFVTMAECIGDDGNGYF